MNPAHWLYVIVGATVGAFTYFALRLMAARVRAWWKTRYVVFSGSEQELYDIKTIRESLSQVNFFQEGVGHYGDAYGGVRTMADTNLFCAGMLGAPLEFEPESIELYFDEVADEADVKELLKNSVFLYVTGSDVRQATIAGMMFEPVFSFMSAEKGGVGATFEEFCRAGAAERVVSATHHFTKKIDVRKISSCENFCVRLEIVRPLKVHGPITLRVALKGVLWRPGVGPGYGPRIKKIKVSPSMPYLLTHYDYF